MRLRELEVDTHQPVGPLTEVYHHGPVTTLGRAESDRDDGPLFVCLDCGYTCADSRQMLHEDCKRGDNPVAQTWREYLTDEDFPAKGE